MAEQDRREAILARLLEVFAAVPGVKAAYRNRLDIAEGKRPAVVMLDADESVEDEPSGRGRPGDYGPFLATMVPEIYIILGGPAAQVGTDLNGLRRLIVKAIFADDSLIRLTKDGDIRYLGFATGLASGRSMEGEAGISFSFRYAIHPPQL